MDPDHSDHAQTKVWPDPAARATKERSSKNGNDKVGKSSNQGNENTNAQLPIGSPSPCGACKFLRRKCAAGCVFSPYFGPDQGSARFAAVHKVFGASNVSKLLLNIPTHRRQDAVVTISYEAQARLSDPVYGCVSTILALQHQVTSLQAELAMVQAQLINNKVAVANALRNAAQQDQEMSFLHLGQSYSNASSTTNNLISVTNDCYASALDLVDAAPAAIGSRRLEPLQLPTSMADDKEEDSRNTIDVIATSNLGCK